MARRRGKRWIAEGYDRATKQKRHLGTFDREKDAKNVEAAWRLRTVGTSRETCDQFAARWITDYPRARKSTNKHYAERVKRFASDFKGVKLGDLDRPIARRWALANPSCLVAVRAMLGDAVRDGLLDQNPFANLRLPSSEGRKRIVALTEPELVALADLALTGRMRLGAFGTQYRAMVLFAGYVGLRPGELFALQRSDVVGQEVTIERALSSTTGEIGPTKTGRWRTVGVPPAAQDALLEVPHHPSGLLFETPSGKRWSKTSHHYYWKRLAKLAGRPGFDHYELRHACATMMLERGATPADVAQQLGHTDGGRLVMSTYGHPSEAGARARNLALWDAQTGPMPIDRFERSGAIRGQAS